MSDDSENRVILVIEEQADRVHQARSNSMAEPGIQRHRRYRRSLPMHPYILAIYRADMKRHVQSEDSPTCWKKSSR